MEVSGEGTQQFLRKRAMTNLEFCLELPEDDPLYKEKKKIIQNKGMDVKESVYIKGSCHDWISNMLRVLLQRARILQLDEVELYFGEMDLQGQGYFSPRNELEALSCILSLIDNTLKGCTSEMKVHLQDLRGATLKEIIEFGEQVPIRTVRSRILENSCVKEKLLLQWAESSGVKSKLQIAYIEGAGRGAVAVEDLEVGEVALEVPASVIISEDLVYESDMFPILEKIQDISAETMLLLWCMRERHDSGSKYNIYFDTLPKNFNTGLSFGMEAIMELQGTLALEEILQAKEHLRLQYDGMFPSLCDTHPDVFPPQFYSWEQYLWACELLYSNSMKVMFVDGRLRTCLIPVAGLLNHSVFPHILQYGKIDSETSTLKFPLSRPCKTGEQCCLSYGNLSSTHLVTFYGFLPQEANPYDVIPLEFDYHVTCSPSEGPLSDNTTHMVRATWLAKNNGIFFYGMPTPLLDHMRKVQNPLVRTMTYSQGNFENEMHVFEKLISIFQDMMKGFGDESGRGNTIGTWDVRLAKEYKDLQIAIVSSNLTSCWSGHRAVELALYNFMEEDERG